MIAITGASGQLGRLVIVQLLKSLPANQLVAAVRSPEKVSDLTELGLKVRQADYNRPETLQTAFAGVQKVLLISSSEVGQRVAQHANVISAAQKAGVELLAYTSILHADQSPLDLAAEHRETEDILAQSGLAHLLLRNGWYSENYAASIPVALEHGAVFGAAGGGRISSAARADYAAAAAAALVAENQAGRVYELAGDDSYTLAEFAAEVGRQSGRDIRYQDLPEAEYASVLLAAGLPEGLARVLAQSDAAAAKGGLFDDGRALSRLIGRATTPMPEVVRQTLVK